jgi:hypothetical protein
MLFSSSSRIISETFVPLCSWSLVWHRMSLRFLGRDTAILMLLKLSCPFRVLLYASLIWFFVMSWGWYSQCIYKVLSLLPSWFSLRICSECRSIEDATVLNIGINVSIWCPRLVRRWINFDAISIKSSLLVLWCQYHMISPVMRPLKQL